MRALTPGSSFHSTYHVGYIESNLTESNLTEQLRSSMSEFPTLLEAQLMLSEFFTEYGEPVKEKDEPFPSTPVGFQLSWPICLHVPFTDRNSVFPLFACCCCCCKWPSAVACCCMSSESSNPPWFSQVRTKGCFRSSVALGLSVGSFWRTWGENPCLDEKDAQGWEGVTL